MTKIKICGLTSPKEADYLNEYLVDFAGVVLFCPKSRRNVSIEEAKDILTSLHPSIKKVAVVISPTLFQVQEIEKAGFDYLQIHGQLSPDFLPLINLPIIKAFNVKDMDSYEFYHSCEQIVGYIFDAQEPGSGKTFDWNLIDSIPKDEKFLLLAGGLTPENVQEAITSVRPDGIDVSSGVEFLNKKGKDKERIDRFVKKVRECR